MKKTINLEFNDWPEWLDINFLASCLSSESNIGDTEVKLTEKITEKKQ